MKFRRHDKKKKKPPKNKKKKNDKNILSVSDFILGILVRRKHLERICTKNITGEVDFQGQT